MRKKRLFYSFCCALILAIPAMSATAATTIPQQIKVGALYASSGPFGPVSTALHRGLTLWVKNVNASGGVYVKPYKQKIPIKLISYDDQSSSATAATLYNRLITQDHVDFLVADAGSVLTSVAVPIAKVHKTLLLDQTGTSRKFFTKDNPYIVQLGIPVTRLWAKPLAKFLENEAVHHGIHRVAILYTTNDFTAPQAKSLKHFITKNGNSKIKIVYFHGVPTSTSTYTVLLHRIQADNPDALIEFGYPDNDIAFLRDLKSSGLHFPMVFTTFPGLATQLLTKNVGVDGVMHTFTYVTAVDLDYKPDIGVGINDFKAAYRKAYGADANIGFNTTAGYNTGLIIQKALETTTSMDQLALRKAVFALSGKLTTVEGHFKLNKKGAQIGMLLPIGQLQAKGHGVELIPVYPPDRAHGKPVWNNN